MQSIMKVVGCTLVMSMLVSAAETNPRADYNAAIHAVLAANGQLIGPDGKRTRDFLPFTEGAKVIGVDLKRCEVSGELFRHLHALPFLERVYLEGSTITDEQLTLVTSLPKLKRLSLWGTEITDIAGPALGQAQHLQALDIHHTVLTDACVEHLSKLRDLRTLQHSMPLGSHALRMVYGLPLLEPPRQLELRNCTDEDLVAIPEVFVSQLQSLSGTNCEFSAAGLIALRDAPLQGLELKNCSMRAEDLFVLPWRSIQWAEFRETPIRVAHFCRLFSQNRLKLSVGEGNQYVWVFQKDVDRNSGVLGPRQLTVRFQGPQSILPPQDLAQIKHVVSLALTVSNASDYIYHLADRSTLLDLEVALTEDVIEIETPPQLQTLVVSGPVLPLSELHRLQQLTQLSIVNQNLTDVDLCSLSALPSLTQLELYSNELHGPGLEHLTTLPNLASLRIVSSNLDDSALPPVAQIKSLREFSAQYSLVTDAGLAFLHGMPKLQNVTVLGSRVTRQGLQNLRESLSNPGVIY